MEIYRLSEKCSDENKIKKYKVCIGIKDNGYVAEYGTLRISVNKIRRILNDVERISCVTCFGNVRPRLENLFSEFEISDYVYDLTGFEDVDENFDVWITY